MRKLVRSLWNGTEREITLLVIDLVVIVLTSFFRSLSGSIVLFKVLIPAFGGRLLYILR